MTEDCERFIQKLEEYPNTSEGIRTMCEKWQSNKRLVKTGTNSIEFVYKGSLGSQNHVFRIELIRKDGPPSLVAYSGDPQQTGAQRRPGSPLISTNVPEDKDKVKNSFGIFPVNLDEKGDWKKDLNEETPEEFYVDFIDHAMRMCRRKQ